MTTTELTNRDRLVGLFLSPTVWTIFFVLVFSLNQEACKRDVLPETAVRPLTTILTIISLLIIGYATRLSYRSWRVDEDNGRFLGIAGLWMNGLFIAFTIGTGIVAWIVTPC